MIDVYTNQKLTIESVPQADGLRTLVKAFKDAAVRLIPEESKMYPY